jgi:hypothetical protein
MKPWILAFALVAAPVWAQTPAAPAMPADYAEVLRTLGRTGDFKDQVLKINIPRGDLDVAVDGVAVPTAFGFGGWLAMTKGDAGMDVMMGDLVLTEREVNPVMTALLDAGLDVTALHNHFFFDTPRVFYLHVHGHGAAADLARRVQPALALIGQGPAAAKGGGRALEGALDTAALSRTIGAPGERNGAVYKITMGRPDITLREMGAAITARMGLNTWAAFYGSDGDAVVAGDIAMLATEVSPVLQALRAHGLLVVAIHQHMIGTSPAIFFLHYWGQGPAAALAEGVRAAVSQTGRR